MDASVLQRTAPGYRFTAATQGKIDMKLNFGHTIEGAVISPSWQVIGMSKAIQIIMNFISGKLPWRKTQNLIVTLSFCQEKSNKPPQALTCIMSPTARIVNATVCYPQINMNH